MCGQTTSALGLRVRPRGRHPLVGLVPTGLEAAVMLQLSRASATGARQPCPWEAVVSHAPLPPETLWGRGGFVLKAMSLCLNAPCIVIIRLRKKQDLS